MIVHDIEVGERTSIHEDGTSTELYTKIEDGEGNEVDLVWLTSDYFTPEKSAELAYHFESIMRILDVDIERFN